MEQEATSNLAIVILILIQEILSMVCIITRGSKTDSNIKTMDTDTNSWKYPGYTDIRDGCLHLLIQSWTMVVLQH